MALATNAHGCELAFDGTGRLHRQARVTLVEGDCGAIGDTVRHTHHRQLQALQQGQRTEIGRVFKQPVAHKLRNA